MKGITRVITVAVALVVFTTTHELASAKPRRDRVFDEKATCAVDPTPPECRQGKREILAKPANICAVYPMSCITKNGKRGWKSEQLSAYCTVRPTDPRCTKRMFKRGELAKTTDICAVDPTSSQCIYQRGKRGWKSAEERSAYCSVHPTDRRCIDGTF